MRQREEVGEYWVNVCLALQQGRSLKDNVQSKGSKIKCKNENTFIFNKNAWSRLNKT